MFGRMRSSRSALDRRATMLALAAGLSVAMVLAGTPALAATQPVTATTTADQPAGDATDWLSLEASARRDGRVPVVVALRAPGPDVTTVTARSRHFRAQRDRLLVRFGGRRPHAFKGLDGAPFVALHATVADLQVLRAADEVRAVSVDRVTRLAGTTNFGAAGGQQLPSMWDYSRIGADWANTNGWTGKGMKIVVIDTGVDRNNPYLQGKVVNEACFATNYYGNGDCPNGGFSQYAITAAGVTGSAAPCSYHAVCAHGTHVAHTAAGQYGVARGASIVAIRASHADWDKIKGVWVPGFSDSDLGNALWYVHDVLPQAGIVAAAVNMSIGGGYGYAGYCDNANSWITYEINLLKSDYEIPTVISSGNDNYPNGITWPACNSNAVSVGNTTLTAASGGVDAVYGYVSPGGSNTAATLDLLAPGTDICSAVPVSLDNDGSADGWQCGWNGTSMAAPHVAGALALLTQKRPSATVDQMLAALKRSGSTGGVAITDSRNTTITRTRINVANALYYSF
jgi:subtilisin family serine protease